MDGQIASFCWTFVRLEVPARPGPNGRARAKCKLIGSICRAVSACLSDWMRAVSMICCTDGIIVCGLSACVSERVMWRRECV